MLLVGANATGNVGVADPGSYTLNGGTVSNDGAAGTTQVINGHLNLNGGTLAATAAANGTYGNFFFYNNGAQVNVSGDTQSVISAALHMAGTHTFNVSNGTAPIDLLVSGRLGNQEALGLPGQDGGTMAVTNAATASAGGPSTRAH